MESGDDKGLQMAGTETSIAETRYSGDNVSIEDKGMMHEGSNAMTRALPTMVCC
jgi:hypothetical protein